MKKILAKALRRVKPRKSDRARLTKLTERLAKRTDAACSKLRVEASAMVVGSAARETWLRDERDIDIFILFPEGLSREELERQGMKVARRVAGRRGREQYAEHPYVRAKFGEYEADLVPCYDVSDPSKIRSAVDRSPHHQRYVKGRLTPELTDEVLILKRFLKSIGIYGSELQIMGFSGYLSELLTLHHGSFERLVQLASGWEPGVVLDLRGRYPDPDEARALFKGQPLIFIDPVDPNRNVAAAVSMQSFTTFVRACQDFARKPSERFFFPRPVKLLTPQQMRGALKRRGTDLLCVAFRAPDLVPDILYPQLRKAERTLASRLTRAGFSVLRSDVRSNGKALILLELTVTELPSVRAHAGPPIGVEIGDFVRKHARSKRKFAGPFVDDKGRLTFEIERKHTRARQVLEEALKERAALGKDVAKALAKGHRIHEGIGVLALGSRNLEIRRFLSEYLTRCLPWLR